MSANNTLSVDERLIEGLSGGEKLKLLLTQKFGSVSSWAIRNGINPPEIFMTLSGKRPYPEHRKKIAKALRVPLAEVDRLIDGKVAA